MREKTKHMNQFKRYEEQLSQLQLTAAEKAFLDEVKAYILSSMSDGHLSVVSLANGLSIHESKLRRRITQSTGLTPKTLLTFIRMQHALELMNNSPAMTIERIAFECGFADHCHFNHTFRRLFGMSPSSYAKQLLIHQNSQLKTSAS